jgi:hypothetical protein
LVGFANRKAVTERENERNEYKQAQKHGFSSKRCELSGKNKGKKVANFVFYVALVFMFCE